MKIDSKTVQSNLQVRFENLEPADQKTPKLKDPIAPPPMAITRLFAKASIFANFLKRRPAHPVAVAKAAHDKATTAEEPIKRMEGLLTIASARADLGPDDQKLIPDTYLDQLAAELFSSDTSDPWKTMEPLPADASPPQLELRRLQLMKHAYALGDTGDVAAFERLLLDLKPLVKQSKEYDAERSLGLAAFGVASKGLRRSVLAASWFAQRGDLEKARHWTKKASECNEALGELGSVGVLKTLAQRLETAVMQVAADGDFSATIDGHQALLELVSVSDRAALLMSSYDQINKDSDAALVAGLEAKIDRLIEQNAPKTDVDSVRAELTVAQKHAQKSD